MFYVCAHISFKVNTSLKQTTRAPQTTNNAPLGGATHSLRTSRLSSSMPISKRITQIKKKEI
jgi:hypothetical protein